MADYTIEGDPFLSAETKSHLAKAKADGVDMSPVDQFLRETAPLMTSPARSPMSAEDFCCVVAAVCFALAVIGGVLVVAGF